MPGSQVGADFWITEYMSPWDVYGHGVTKVLAYRKTPYQDMYIVENGPNGKALVLDGKWQSRTLDEFLYHEALVHPPMIAQGAPRQVLVLGGGEGATVREILRWNSVERVVMVDIDGDVVDACKDHLPEMHQGAFADPRLEVVIGDALHYLDDTTATWDVVVSDLTDPLEDGPSFQLFTQEYFQQVHRALAPGGTMVLQAGPVTPNSVEQYARVVHTLSTVFAHVLPYSSFMPSFGQPWGMVLASDNPIDSRPNPEVIDQLLLEKTRGGFQLLDGAMLLGLLQCPLYVRKAIAQTTAIYTMKEPPKFFTNEVPEVD